MGRHIRVMCWIEKGLLKIEGSRTFFVRRGRLSWALLTREAKGKAFRGRQTGWTVSRGRNSVETSFSYSRSRREIKHGWSLRGKGTGVWEEDRRVWAQVTLRLDMVKNSDFILTTISKYERAECRRSEKLQVSEDNWLLRMGVEMLLDGDHFKAEL